MAARNNLPQPKVPAWKNKSKTGRPLLFSEPQLLMEAAEEYFAWCDANPLYKLEFNGKDARRCEVPMMRVYTIVGFALYCGVSQSWLRTFEWNLNHNKVAIDEEKKEQFLTILECIRDTIANQQIEGACSGFFNANIISRMNNLAEKVDAKNESTLKIDGPVEVVTRTSRVPLASSESEVNTNRDETQA